ncbi:Tetratricopeptide repeat protein [Aeoliella mucimassa]|uniref:Tetratricopeptide repeat protein n=2 Tax=Aeoliella mucimassa TaxID=2527972 RepID=A0A518AIX1_9BACT|nr:Tetratricopeptide repeat protein [Aeoliella mucimassa]
MFVVAFGIASSSQGSEEPEAQKPDVDLFLFPSAAMRIEDYLKKDLIDGTRSDETCRQRAEQLLEAVVSYKSGDLEAVEAGLESFEELRKNNPSRGSCEAIDLFFSNLLQANIEFIRGDFEQADAALDRAAEVPHDLGNWAEAILASLQGHVHFAKYQFAKGMEDFELAASHCNWESPTAYHSLSLDVQLNLARGEAIVGKLKAANKRLYKALPRPLEETNPPSWEFMVMDHAVTTKGIILSESASWHEALEIFERSIAIRKYLRKETGNKELSFASEDVLLRILAARCAIDAKKYDKALNHLQKASQLCSNREKPRTPQLAENMVLTAITLYELGHVDEVEKLLKAIPTTTDSNISSAVPMSVTLIDMDDIPTDCPVEKRTSHYLRAETSLRNELHLRHVDAIAGAAMMLTYTDEPTSAQHYFQESLKEARALCGAGHPLASTIALCLADYHAKQGQLELAIATLEYQQQEAARDPCDFCNLKVAEGLKGDITKKLADFKAKLHPAEKTALRD